MWDWKRPFSGTNSRRNPLETAFLAQSKAIADTMKRQQDLLAQQQATLDRIVASKYDRPLVVPAKQESDPMPQWLMNDQGDVTPDAIAAITVESDEEFLQRAGVK